MEGYKAIESNEDRSRGERSLWAQCQAVADMKFTYVISCQQYGIDKRSGDRRAQDILRLMTMCFSKLNTWKLSFFRTFCLCIYFHLADTPHFV